MFRVLSKEGFFSPETRNDNLQVVFCPNKQSSFEPFMCLALVKRGV